MKGLKPAVLGDRIPDELQIAYDLAGEVGEFSKPTLLEPLTELLELAWQLSQSGIEGVKVHAL